MLSEVRSSEGRSYAVEASLPHYDSQRAAKLLRLHHGQPVRHSLHRFHRQFAQESIPAQVPSPRRFHQQVRCGAALVLGIVRRCTPGSCARETIEGLVQDKEDRADRIAKPALAGLGQRVVPVDETFPLVMLSEGGSSKGRSSAVEASLIPRMTARERRSHCVYITRQPAGHLVSPAICTSGQSIISLLGWSAPPNKDERTAVALVGTLRLRRIVLRTILLRSA